MVWDPRRQFSEGEILAGTREAANTYFIVLDRYGSRWGDYNSDSDEISWWFPETRAVMEPGDMKVNKSLKKCINKKTVGIMIPNLLGNIPDWQNIYKIARKYNLKIIEDSADTIGFTFKKTNTTAVVTKIH